LDDPNKIVKFRDDLKLLFNGSNVDEESAFTVPDYLFVDVNNLQQLYEEYKNIKEYADKYDVDISKHIKFPEKSNNNNIDSKQKSDYKTFKVPLFSNMKDITAYNRINELVFSIKKLKVTLYLFMRLYILYKFSKINSVLDLWKEDFIQNNVLVGKLPNIDEDFVFCCIHTLTEKDGRGPPIKNESKIKLLQEINNFYDELFIKLIPNYQKINVTNCSQLLSYIYTEVVTNYNNIVEVYFFQHFFRFINLYVRHFFQENIDACATKKEQKVVQSYIIKLSKKVKIALINETYSNLQDVFPQILQIKDYILPKLDENRTHALNVKENPQMYIPYLMNMNAILEVINKPLFQVIPLSKSLIPDHIKIDTKMLVDLFITNNKNKYLGNIEAYQKEIWNKFFKINKRIFKPKGHTYKFDYMINTDGRSASLSFFKEGAKKQKSGKYNKQKNDIPYIDELSFEQLTHIKTETTILYDDPGKKNIHYMMDNEGKRLRYSSKQRSSQLQTREYRVKLEDFREIKVEDVTLKEYDELLTQYNSKTCRYDKFKEYVVKKMEMLKKLPNIYSSIFFRNWRARSYMNRQRSESKFVKKLIDQYGKTGKKIVIFIGNWSQKKQMRNFISTPGKGLIKRITRISNGQIKFIMIDEYRTSCIDYKTGEILENKEVKIEGETVRLHSVLTRKEENNRNECIHRDFNSVNNYKTIVEYYMRYYSRPLPFIRETDIKDSKVRRELKGINERLKTGPGAE